LKKEALQSIGLQFTRTSLVKPSRVPLFACLSVAPGYSLFDFNDEL